MVALRYHAPAATAPSRRSRGERGVRSGPHRGHAPIENWGVVADFEVAVHQLVEAAAGGQAGYGTLVYYLVPAIGILSAARIALRRFLSLLRDGWKLVLMASFFAALLISTVAPPSATCSR